MKLPTTAMRNVNVKIQLICNNNSKEREHERVPYGFSNDGAYEANRRLPIAAEMKGRFQLERRRVAAAIRRRLLLSRNSLFSRAFSVSASGLTKRN